MKTQWLVVSAVSIRRSQVAFSWSSSYLSRPCHASRCFINISKNRRRPVFLTCRRSLRSNSWKLQAKLDAIHVLTKEEYTVWLTVKSVFFYFFFFLCMTASEIEMGGGTYLHLWIDVRTPRKCWPVPTLPHVTLFATRSFPTFVGEGARRTQMRRRRGGEGRYSQSPGAREFVTG